MTRQTDQQLLSEYAGSRSEGAFGELVRRHVDFIHSSAMRLVHDAHLAEDVTQGVFVALAQNARRLADRPVLAGWLHRTAQNLAANIVRTNVRRRAREQAVVAMNELSAAESAPPWEHIAPHLDAALGALNETDRDVVVLRYFQGKSAQEIAHAFGLSDEAAQKRISRGVERLREVFSRRGITVATSGLVAVIGANAVQAAPVGLAATISSAAVLVGTTVPASTALVSAKIIAMTTLQKAMTAAALAAALGTGIYQVRQAARRREPVQQLRQASLAALSPKEVAADPPPDLPRPLTSTPSTTIATPSGPETEATAAVPFPATRIYDLLKQKVPKLSRAQVDPYLEANGRSAASLLAAFRTTTDPSLLAEAIQKYPTDPQVGFEAAIANGASPEERRQRLDAFLTADPENSLADYLSALDHFKAGETEATIKDLVGAASKPAFEDYSHERKQTDEEVYLAAGYPLGEAKLLGNAFLIEPELAQFRELGKYLVKLAGSYQEFGDENSQQNALQMGLDLGRRFGDPSAGEPLLHQLVGISIERMALDAMNPTSPVGPDGQTVQGRLNQLVEGKEALHILTGEADRLWQRLSDQDWINYHEQVSALGEEAALRWLIASVGHN